MSDAAATEDRTIGSLPDTSRPRLHPAPGRCIVRIVPRLTPGGANAKDDDEGVAKTAAGLVVAADLRYQNQPMVGSLYEIGDPTSEREEAIAKWATEEADAGHLFVFSTYGAGSPYWDDHMKTFQAFGYDFRWLQGYRLFDIGNLAATIEGSGPFGEIIRERPSGLILPVH